MLLTVGGEQLLEGPGSGRQSVYASAPGRRITIRRIIEMAWRDMAMEDREIDRPCQSAAGAQERFIEVFV
jgi:hypothetical protein